MKDGAGGKRVKCPGCGQLMLVPAECSVSQMVSVAPKPPLPVKTKSGINFPEQPLPKQKAVAIGLSGPNVTREDLKETARSHPPDDSVPCPICQVTLKARNLVPHYDQNHAPADSAASTPKTEGSSHAQPTDAAPAIDGSIPPAKIATASIITVLAFSCACVAVVFVITFLAGALLAFLVPIVKSLQGVGNKSLFQIAAFAILGILFIGSFLVFNLAPLFVTAAACTNAQDEFGDGYSRTKRVVLVLALALLSSVLLWVFLPWLQYVPYRTAEWSESTLTMYRWIYVGINLVVGVIIAAQAGSPRKQPAAPQAEPQAAPKRDGV